MENSTPARLYALILGAVLVGAGIIGFFYESTFTSDKSVRDAVFGILEVNGWHNVVHIASGALGLLAFVAGASASRTFALGFGVVYLGVAAWGFVIGDGDSILSVVPVNTEDNVLHAIFAVAGFAVYALTTQARTHAVPPARPTTA